MKAEEIPNIVSYQSLLDVMSQKTLAGYSIEERVEVAHLMQNLRHLQSETEYRALLATQKSQFGEPDCPLSAVALWWKALEVRCSLLFQRAFSKFSVQ